jgi:hypothetical protein
MQSFLHGSGGGVVLTHEPIELFAAYAERFSPVVHLGFLVQADAANVLRRALLQVIGHDVFSDVVRPATYTKVQSGDLPDLAIHPTCRAFLTFTSTGVRTARAA